MNTLHFYINDQLDTDRLTLIKADLLAMSHVQSVEFGKGMPSEFTVEVDEHCNMTMNVMQQLNRAGLNPEINIQHQDNRSNPHHTQELDKVKKFLGYTNEDGIYEQWKSKYSLDVIGTSYCRSRTIPCTAKEFDQMRAFKNARQSFVQSHYTWAEMIQKDMRDIT